MFEFFLSKLSPLGDNDPKWRQAYWGEANGEDLPVKFNSMNPHIQSGMTITAEEKAMKKSTKGTTYWQLKKVKVVDNNGTVQAAEPTPNANPSNEVVIAPAVDYKPQLDRIEAKLDKLLGMDAALDEPAKDTVYDVPAGDAPMPEDFLL